MIKKNQVLACIVLAVLSQGAISGQLCGKVSNNSLWQGGVFSVINSKGTTIASTEYISAGKLGCTPVFKEGSYLIRFNGALDNRPRAYDDVYGCITDAPYTFDDTNVISIVFENGNPPFNGNHFCRPDKNVI